MTAVGVVFGGPSPEHDISILTGLQAARLLHGADFEVKCLYWTKAGKWLLVPSASEASAFLEPTIAGSTELELQVPGGFHEHRRLRTQALELSVVVNCCHGGPGEDGSLTALLRLAGLRVTGPNPDAAALAMDKFATAAIAEQIGVPTIPTRLLGDAIDLAPPWVVKPRFGGSSIGVEAGVRDLGTAQALGRQGVGRAGCVVQPYLDGWTDLNVAVRTAPNTQLSAVERPIRSDSPILDYRTKYLKGHDGMESTPRELPALIPDSLVHRIGAGALSLVSALGLTGIPRVDFLWDGHDELYVCEVNSIPGALGLYLWEAAGVSRIEVLRDWISEAMSGSLAPPQWTASSDGTALRTAGTISSKLSI